MKNKGLIEGSVFKVIILFMIPLIIGNFFQQMYSLVDAYIVGRTINNVAFSGVSATGSLTFLVIGASQGLTSGFCVRVSQYFGEKNYEKVRRSLGTIYMLCIIIGLLFTIISFSCTKPLLNLINTQENLYNYAYNYMRFIFLGLGASIFYNLMSFIMRAVGDSRTPLYFLILSSVLNIGFDLLFIVGFKMQTEGAAFATVLSQLISGFLCLFVMLKKYPFLKISKSDLKLEWGFVKEHLVIGLPMCFQFAIIAIGLMVQQYTVNSLDAANNALLGANESKDVFATSYAAASKIDTFANSMISAIGTTMATYVGQNYGARRYDRIKKGLFVGTLYGSIMCLTFVFVVLLFGQNLCNLLVKGLEPKMLDNAQIFLTIQASFYVFLMIIYVYRNSLQGLGKGMITFTSSILELSMRILACLLLTKFIHWYGFSLSSPLAWIGADLLFIPAIIVSLRKVKKEFAVN